MVKQAEEFYCEKCDELFYAREQAENHEQNCSLANEFKCDMCEHITDLSGDIHGWQSEGCHYFDLGRMGYGSGLDGSEVQFQICDNCLIGFIDSLPWKARARIYNSGSNERMNDDQWIRMHQNKISDEEAESLGFTR